jgi:hypothetical protein
MSHDATSWARKQQVGNASAKFLLMMLADYAGSDYSCWPRQETLAALTEMTERTIRRATGLLVTQGLIRVFYRYRADNTRRSLRYQLLIDGHDTALPETVDWKSMRQVVPGDPEDSVSDGPSDTESSSTGHKVRDDRTEVPDLPVAVEPADEPLVENPGAARSGDVVEGEIVDDGALFSTPVGAAVEVADTPNAGQLTKRWIDYCTEHNVKLTTSVIKRYGMGVRKALADGFEEKLIRRALAAMLHDRVASRPALLDTYLVRVQQGPEMPPERMSQLQANAERRAQANGWASSVDQINDILTREA